MRLLLLIVLLNGLLVPAMAQRQCGSDAYREKNSTADHQHLSVESSKASKADVVGLDYSSPDTTTIVIPVVVHVVYYNEQGNISNEQILSQIAALNRDFNKENKDINKIPTHFSPFAASAGIRFVLANIDPNGAPTTGITRKQTGTRYFRDDDKVKFSSTGGVDAWDPSSYLNIWVCDLDYNLMGYASFPGGPLSRDGVVIDYTVFGTTSNIKAPYNLGRTATHEIGHWLGLKHIWGDTYCGDDGIDDTPQQQKPSRGCPSGNIHSCGETSHGDMYMNFMDFTDDACMYMFTHGQRTAMRALFHKGGARSAMIASKGASGESVPLPAPIDGVELHDAQPSFFVGLYPNPATDKLTIESRSLVAGQFAQIYNHLGQMVMTVPLNKAQETVNISSLKSGVYYVRLANSGKQNMEKFVKM